MVNKYMPKKGDVVFIDLLPVKGHEQGGFRPAIVISNNIFNKYTNMMVVCPISSNIKFFPSHYILEDTKKVKGSVFCEHIRSVDYLSRKVVFVEKLSQNDLLSILMIHEGCVDDNIICYKQLITSFKKLFFCCIIIVYEGG